MEERLKECLRIALAYHVSDIHFNLNADDTVVIEMRVAGRIRQLKHSDSDGSFFRYLLYRANLDVGNPMMPQTGSFEEEVDGKRLALRFALVSSYHMTSGVMRILNNHSLLTVESLSRDSEQRKWFQNLGEHRSGLVVFSGPTGSGKTTSLYTILNEIQGKKIFTLEDPVEVYSEKYVQLQINEKQHLGYAEGIRQLLRHDPDIILIGEIRDSTAARMAVRCALTGHLVLTSLHSFSCVSAIQRLLDLEVSETQLQDVLTGISNQRLYDTQDGKTGIYEIMDRKEIAYYFAYGQTSSQFQSLSQKLEEAEDQGIVSRDQAAQDLSG